MSNIELLDKIVLSDDAVDRFYAEYENNHDFGSWIDLLLPEVRECYNNPQNHPRHKYDILGHILHSVEEINKQTKALPAPDRKMLAYTMFLHDIGKPQTKKVNPKTGYDCFYDHNLTSEKVAIRVLPELGFDDKDSAIIATLVNKHDMFINIKPFRSRNPFFRYMSPELVQEEARNLDTLGDGSRLLQYLVMVSRADNLAQNEQETAESLTQLDTFESMLNRYTSPNPTLNYRGEAQTQDATQLAQKPTTQEPKGQ